MSKRYALRGFRLYAFVALCTVLVSGCTGQINYTAFYCDHISVSYTAQNAAPNEIVNATLSANGSIIATMTNIPIYSGTFTVSGSFAPQPAGTVLTLNVSNGQTASGPCTSTATWFNPGDGRVDAKPGDRIALYCDQTSRALIVYGVRNDSTGFYQGRFAYKDLLAAGKNGLSVNNGTNGVVSASTDGKGNFWVAWNGGQYGANGRPDQGFAKGIACTFNQ